MADIAELREEIGQALTSCPAAWDADDRDGFVDSLCELIDARMAWERDRPRAAVRDPHTPGSMRWLAARMVATANTAEDIESSRQQLMAQSKRQLIDLIQQLATEAAAL